MEAAKKHLAKHDKVLDSLIDTLEVKPPAAHTNYYEELVSSIISQQLSVKAAETIQNRFKALFDDRFPSPEQILETDIETLRGVGLSRPKAGYMKDLAQKIIDDEVNFDGIDQLTNDEIVAELTAVKGIGVWTAQMFLMFCMERQDILPTGDLGIRTGIKQLYGFDHLPDAAEINQLAQQNHWHPFESIVSWYIWQSLGNKPAL